ncbi:MAG: hypothetical protein J6T94_02830 [Bacteroidaceae bacterium]|nr:hypothetical protein [Bacteroidaceae bacterium]
MKRRGKSYAKRVADVNALYDKYARSGLSNREIWRRYIWPRFGISERTMYNLLKAPMDSRIESRSELSAEGFLFPELLEDERRDPSYYKKHPQ